MSEKEQTLSETVLAITGPIKPVADTHIDQERFSNLNNLCETVSKLIDEIYDVASHKHSDFSSCKKAGYRADRFIISLSEYANQE